MPHTNFPRVPWVTAVQVDPVVMHATRIAWPPRCFRCLPMWLWLWLMWSLSSGSSLVWMACCRPRRERSACHCDVWSFVLKTYMTMPWMSTTRTVLRAFESLSPGYNLQFGSNSLFKNLIVNWIFMIQRIVPFHLNWQIYAHGLKYYNHV